jgi:hypothetical protein
VDSEVHRYHNVDTTLVWPVWLAPPPLEAIDCAITEHSLVSAVFVCTRSGDLRQRAQRKALLGSMKMENAEKLSTLSHSQALPNQRFQANRCSFTRQGITEPQHLTGSLQECLDHALPSPPWQQNARCRITKEMKKMELRPPPGGRHGALSQINALQRDRTSPTIVRHTTLRERT